MVLVNLAMNGASVSVLIGFLVGMIGAVISWLVKPRDDMPCSIDLARVMSCSRSSKYLGSSLGRVVSNFGAVRSPCIGIWKV